MDTFFSGQRTFWQHTANSRNPPFFRSGVPKAPVPFSGSEAELALIDASIADGSDALPPIILRTNSERKARLVAGERDSVNSDQALDERKLSHITQAKSLCDITQTIHPDSPGFTSPCYASGCCLQPLHAGALALLWQLFISIGNPLIADTRIELQGVKRPD